MSPRGRRIIPRQMSEMPQGPGWWQASDDRWYPPVAPTVGLPLVEPVAPPAPPPADARRIWRTGHMVVVGVAALLLGLIIGAAAGAASKSKNTNVASQVTSTTASATSTSAAPAPTAPASTAAPVTASATTQPPATAAPTTPAPAKWVTVFTFSGQGVKASNNFNLTGGQTQLIYSAKGDVSIYLYPSDHQESEGGFPIAECPATCQNQQTRVQVDAPGAYYFDINAVPDATYSMVIQEYR